MKVLILIFIVFFTSTFAENIEQKNKLNELFNKLKIVNNSKMAELLEKKIWSVWHEHPSNNKLTSKLKLGTELMEHGSYDYALKVFNNIIMSDPEWSEAWNKRATLFFLMEKYSKSLADIEKVLSIESRHFGALSGQARIFIKIREYEKAIVSLERALKFYPLFRSGQLIPKLEKLIIEQSI
jgi:tetratricopeptide (TPR) repeat protein